ncbi:hypothetical protein JTB14_003947 [Gonioctena quinquepunctata]|nr:hypothetical protein JTB14_003947 [Gonioctena quinquepunctata]
MLTTEDFGLEEYVFKSSPESCSDGSYGTDYMDVTSDEDFMTLLSVDLDIPLLLNPGEDELSMLNSFYDKSPDEILSDIASPPYDREEELSNEISELQNMDFSKCGPESYPNLHSEIKSEQFASSDSLDSVKSVAPKPHIKEEIQIKSPPPSPGSNSSTESLNDLPKNIIRVKIVPNSHPNMLNLHTKHVPIVPKTTYTLPAKKNLLVLNKESKPVVTSSQPNVILLENVTSSPQVSSVNKAPITTVSSMTVPSVVINPGKRFSMANPNVDPRILKRQQRKIKNRESASLSRKKKKDYVTSLEEHVKILGAENKRLQTENFQLKERLGQYEDSFNNKKGNKAVRPSLVLCVFLLVFGLNSDLIRNPLNKKNELVVEQDLSKPNAHYGRSLLWTPDNIEDIQNQTSKFSPLTMCPAAINQTESARLVLELERWIGKPMDLRNIGPGKNSSTPVKSTRLRYKKKKSGSNSPSMSSYKRYRGVKNVQKVEDGPRNEIQIYTLGPEQMYSEFFQAINRQDDTFYVVSFTHQHMLLPALHHNKTRRPKMSLIMPSMLPNDNVSHSSMVPLMQIDCEVLDTRLIHIKHGSIPQHLKAYSNATKKEHVDDEKVSDPTASEPHYYKKPYKPYFINKYSLKHNGGIFEIN